MCFKAGKRYGMDWWDTASYQQTAEERVQKKILCDILEVIFHDRNAHDILYRFSLTASDHGKYLYIWIKTEKYFFWRILLGIVLYFGLALTTFYLLAGIPSENPFISIIYYSCMFVYSLITMNLCFDEKREELFIFRCLWLCNTAYFIRSCYNHCWTYRDWIFNILGIPADPAAAVSDRFHCNLLDNRAALRRKGRT